MTLTIDVTPESLTRLEAQAQEEGKPLEEFLRSELERLAAPTLTAKQKAAIALLDAWRAEDATEDPDELARRDAELEEFKANINANRAATGERRIYP
jgi:hypothetical protein